MSALALALALVRIVLLLTRLAQLCQVRSLLPPRPPPAPPTTPSHTLSKGLGLYPLYLCLAFASRSAGACLARALVSVNLICKGPALPSTPVAGSFASSCATPPTPACEFVRPPAACRGIVTCSDHASTRAVLFQPGGRTLISSCLLTRRLTDNLVHTAPATSCLNESARSLHACLDIYLAA